MKKEERKVNVLATPIQESLETLSKSSDILGFEKLPEKVSALRQRLDGLLGDFNASLAEYRAGRGWADPKEAVKFAKDGIALEVQLAELKTETEALCQEFSVTPQGLVKTRIQGRSHTVFFSFSN